MGRGVIREKRMMGEGGRVMKRVKIEDWLVGEGWEVCKGFRG